VYALFLPCSYATKANAAACMGSFSVTYSLSYAASPTLLGPNITRAVPPSAIRVLSCGEAVAASRGRLPPGTCGSIGRQLSAASKLPTGISNSTALFVVDLSAVLPTYTGVVWPTVSVKLSSAVPSVYRNFGVLATASIARTVSIAGPNRPAELAKLVGSGARSCWQSHLALHCACVGQV
jgi:hypothetical protein